MVFGSTRDGRIWFLLGRRSGYETLSPSPMDRRYHSIIVIEYLLVVVIVWTVHGIMTANDLHGHIWWCSGVRLLWIEWSELARSGRIHMWMSIEPKDVTKIVSIR